MRTVLLTIVAIGLPFLLFDDGLAADPEVQARTAAENYLDYVVERSQRDSGYFERLFGVPLPDSGQAEVTLGTPFTVVSLHQDGAEKFANGDEDILTHAKRSGFEFPVVVEGVVVALVETMWRDRKWVWSQLRARRDTILAAFKQNRVEKASDGDQDEFMFLQTYGFGSYLIVRDRGGFTKIAPIGKHSVRHLGLEQAGEGLFVDYSTVEGRLRSRAAGELDD